MNLEKYIDEGVKLYDSIYSKLDAWSKAKQAARAKLKAEAVRLTQEAANEEHDKFVKEYEEKLSAILSELDSGLSEIEGKYLQEVNGFYSLDGSAINAEDKALLEAGILTVDEVISMVYKYADNPTKERIIKKYTEENHIQNLPTDAVKALLRAASGGDKEKFVFTKFKQLMGTPVSMAEQDMAGTDAFANTVKKAGEYAEECKLDLLRAKGTLTDAEKRTLAVAESNRVAAANAKYDPHHIDYGWHWGE